MGHMNFENMIKINTKQGVREIPKIIKPSITMFNQCQHGKQSRGDFKIEEYATFKPSELVHTYLCVPTRTKILLGERYFMLLIDDYTRMTWVTFLKKKLKHLTNSWNSNL
jgi:hypothetical protein